MIRRGAPGDAAALHPLLSEDFAETRARVFQIGKAQWLQRYESGSLVNEGFESTDVAVRRYGTVSAVTGVQNQTAAAEGDPFPSGSG